MLKILRKHNKMILVVGGTLLLISFLIPQAIQQIGQAQLGRPVGTMDGRKVSLATYDQSRRELAMLEAFFQRLGLNFPLPLVEGREVEHWMLLAQEARQGGMVGGAEEGASLLPVLARAYAQNVIRGQYGQLAEYFIQSQPEQVEQLVANSEQMMAEARLTAAGTAGRTSDEFDRALATLRGITRMVDAYRTAERISDRQAATIAEDLADSVVIDAAWLGARRLADESLEPSEEDLRAHFERFREFGPGEGPYGIGYRLPPRVKIEWIELSRPAIMDAVEISLLDATKHYQQNRDRFPGPFEAEREKVEAELRQAKTEEILQDAVAVVRSEVAKAVRPLAEEEGYKMLPPDWAGRRPDFVAIADQVVSTIADSHGVSLPTPAVYIKDNAWLDERLLAQQPGIGASTVRFAGQQPARFPQVVMAVRELVGDSVLGLQTGIPAVELSARGPEGSVYFYTVLDAAPAETPTSMEQLLDPERLVEDWRALQRYEALVEDTGQLAERAASEGLEAFAEGFGEIRSEAPDEATEPPPPTPKVTVTEGARVTERQTEGLVNAQNSAEVIRDVRARAETIDPLTPIDQVPLEQRVVVTPVPSRLGVLVSVIEGVQPLTWETLPVYADYARQMHWQESFQGVGMPFPFRFETLKERHAFELREAARDEDGERLPPAPESEAEPEPAPAAG